MSELHFARYRSPSKFTHYLFRFPAKFHPPAVRCLIERFSDRQDTILDPFCGSGTLMLEAMLAGRVAIGLDVDPVAAFISRVKCTPLDPTTLRGAFEGLQRGLGTKRRPSHEYDRLIHEDLSPRSVERFRAYLDIPRIPNITHWFRTHVILDLAKLRSAILELRTTASVRDFFLACFASIIRNASNADPVPVSGLEVTAHMKRLDARGRRIDAFQLFERKVERELHGMTELWSHSKNADVIVRLGDATQMTRHIVPESVDLVITSPPYNTAVDYYRRHTLEMYWLNLVRSHEERLRLAVKYLGRVQVRVGNPRLATTFSSGYIKRLARHARSVSLVRERAFVHYCASMELSLQHIARVLKPARKAVLVVGNSKWNGRRVRATRLLIELARSEFKVCETLTYSTRNRYMSYERHNGASINREYALVLKKKA